MPAGYEVRLLRRVLPRDGTALIELGPLDDDTAAGLVRAWSRPPGPGLGTARSFVAAAAGNPYYLRHLVLADRDGRTADTPGPELTDAVSRHLQPLADDTRQLLRAIAFLGNNYLVTDLAAVTGRSAPELLPAVEEALAAGLLVEDGRRLRFRHPVIRRVLRGAIPTALRVLMHRQFAQRLAEAGGDLGRVAGQLLAGPVPVDAWVQDWLIAHAAQLSATAPAPAIAVLRHAVSAPGLSAPARELLTAQLARVLHRSGPPAGAEASWVSARTGDAARRAEMDRIARRDSGHAGSGRSVKGLRVTVLGPVRAWNGEVEIDLGPGPAAGRVRGAGGQRQPPGHLRRADPRALGRVGAEHRGRQRLHVRLGPAAQPGPGRRAAPLRPGRLHAAPRTGRPGRRPVRGAVRGSRGAGRRRRGPGRPWPCSTRRSRSGTATRTRT